MSAKYFSILSESETILEYKDAVHENTKKRETRDEEREALEKK